jgi:hypothetical protein
MNLQEACSVKGLVEASKAIIYGQVLDNYCAHAL